MRIAAPSIVGTGLFALDVVVRLDGSVAAPSLGGSAGNVLSILGSLGWTAAPVGTIGDDPAASTICSDFQRAGADTRFLRRSLSRNTPVIYQHQLRSSGESSGPTHRFTFTCPDCGTRRRPVWEDEPTLTSFQAELPSATVFYLDRPTRMGVLLAEDYAQRGAMVVFEPSDVGDDRELFARALRSAHVVKYADERIGHLEAFGLRAGAVEIQTRGPKGLRFRAQSLSPHWTHLGAYELPYVHDTAGAGDWCTAGFIFALFSDRAASPLAEGETLARALAFGQALAALNCLTEGARGLLAAWPAARIIRSAHELSESVGRNPQGSACHLDTLVRGLAHDVQQATREHSSSSNGLYCCSAP